MAIAEGIIFALCVLSILFFAIYIVGLLRMPTKSRPATPSYNRFGEIVGDLENPGFEETEDELHP